LATKITIRKTSMKTVLITGCLSGFGLETARYFLERDWKVIATMRMPREDVLPRSERLRVIALDITNSANIDGAVAAAGPVDVLVNNAGIGMLGPLEGTSMQTIREVFETNTFGTIAMTKAMLPQFRQRNAGLIVNVSSSATLKALPFLSVYTASKAAVTAFTESLALELKQFNIRVSLVVPGRSPTRFSDNAKTRNAGRCSRGLRWLSEKWVCRNAAIDRGDSAYRCGGSCVACSDGPRVPQSHRCRRRRLGIGRRLTCASPLLYRCC
jgi:short-subunit dehydrogenase